MQQDGIYMLIPRRLSPSAEVPGVVVINHALYPMVSLCSKGGFYSSPHNVTKEGALIMDMFSNDPAALSISTRAGSNKGLALDNSQHTHFVQELWALIQSPSQQPWCSDAVGWWQVARARGVV